MLIVPSAVDRCGSPDLLTGILLSQQGPLQPWLQVQDGLLSAIAALQTPFPEQSR